MADAQEQKPEEQQSKDKEGGGSNKLLFWIILAGILVANSVVAAVIVMATSKNMGEGKPATEEIVDTSSADEAPAVSMGAISDPPIEAIVNVAGTDGMRFLKVQVVFEYDEKKYKNLGAELARRAPQLKDLLIGHLSKLSLNQLKRPDAKEEIRKEVKRLVNNTLPEDDVGKVRDVYFNDFIIQ
jgi:flagellar basal body-associated protein FliL